MYAYGGHPQFPGEEYTDAPPFYPCSGEMLEAEVEGISKIEETYQYCLKRTSLGKSEEIALAIDFLAERVKEECRNDPDYYKLVFILTSEDVKGVEDLQRKIIGYSKLPMSIVFVEMTETTQPNLRLLKPNKPVSEKPPYQR